MQINLCFQCMEETTSNPCPHCGHFYQEHAQPEYALQPGTILHGKYLIGNVLGQGGFGITYICLDIALARKVAVKEYFPASHVFRDTTAGTALQWNATESAQMAHKTGKESFLKEAKKMNRVDTLSQIVHVLEVFEDNNTAYIVMDYIAGSSLAQHIKQRGPLSWKTVQDLILPVADVMQQVHTAGLIHRDLSPDNLIIQPNGTIRILDLGAAKDLHLHSGTSSMQVAKRGFSPIEQYVQTSPSGPWTDVYSIAATIYFSLTGIIPPSAIDRMGGASISWDLPQLRSIPLPIIRVLQKGMALNGKDRYQSMQSFVAELRKPSSGKKRKALFTGIAAAAVIVAVLLAAGFRNPAGEPTIRVTPEETTQETISPANNPQQQTADPLGIGETWYTNVLSSSVIPEQYEYDVEKAPVFNSRIARYQILSVTFLDSLENMGSGSWDVSQNKDGSVMAWTTKNGTVSIWMDSQTVNSDAYHLYIAAEGGINGKYCAHLFDGFSNTMSINFNNCFHTDNAKSMEYMFRDCGKLSELDTAALNTCNVRNMYGMFSSCNVSKLDLSKFDTSNVEAMDYMFYFCRNLKSLDLSGFDTSKVTGMNQMFSWTTSLTDPDISSFDTSAVTDMSFMFSHTAAKDLDLSHFDTSRAETIAYMFSGCSDLEKLNVTGWNTAGVTRMEHVFSDCTNLTAIIGIEDWDTSHVQNYADFMDPGKNVGGKPWEKLFEK